MTKKNDEIRKGHCPRCGAGRSADVVGRYEKTDHDEENGIWFSQEFLILKCRGCETPYFQTVESDSESYNHWHDAYGEEHYEADERISHWPSPVKRSQPEWSTKISWADSDLGSLFEDIYGALNADLRVPAAIAVRTALDRASELLQVDPALSFAEKLNELHAGGKISADEKDTLSVLVDAGGAAAHRAWRPGPRELDTMLSLIEGFLHRTFVLGDDAKRLKKVLPAKPKRKKKPKPASSPNAAKAGKKGGATKN